MSCTLSACRALLTICTFKSFSSVQSLSHVWLFATLWIAARQASLSITNSRSSIRLTIESLMPSSHLTLCHPLLLLPPIPPSISLFRWVNSSREVAKVLEFQLQHHSFQRIMQVIFSKAYPDHLFPLFCCHPSPPWVPPIPSRRKGVAYKHTVGPPDLQVPHLWFR